MATEPCRIYAPCGELFALVDEIDFAWAAQWRWSLKWSRGGTKVYLRRVEHLTLEPGRSKEMRLQRTIWLHRAILIERMRVEPPTPQHVIAGHANGDELDCRRENLQWETHSSNNRNRRPNGATLRRRLGL